MYKKHRHIHIFSYSDLGYAGKKGDKKSITCYCTFVEENIVTWETKKQDIISTSSAEVKYSHDSYCL